MASNTQQDYKYIALGYKFDGTIIDLEKITEISNPKRRESLFPFHIRNVKWNDTSKWNGFLSKLFLKDAIDLPILSVYISILFTAIPSSIGLLYCCMTNYFSTNYFSTNILHIYGICHNIITLVQAQGFILGLHYSTHNRIWKKQWKWLDILINFIYCPLFGIPCGAYYYHHIIMHHKEDNKLNYDASSTMPYKRNNLLCLLLYILRYILFIWIELPILLIKKKQYYDLLKLILSSLIYFTVIFKTIFIIPIFTNYILILPYLIISCALMRGNQLQHLFVSPDDPNCDYKLSYNICNSTYNELSFNDCFHIEHHLFPCLHWSHLPFKFLSMLPLHKKNDSFIFTGIEPDKIHSLVYNKKFEELADYYVYIGQKSGKNKSVLVDEMKRRLLPIFIY